MAEGTQDDGAYGRSADPAEDAAEHLAAAIGTPAWAEARDGMLGLLPGDDPQVSERIEAWAAEAAQREGEKLTGFLTESLPTWREEIASALADDPERAEEARRFADSVQSLLCPPDGTTTQVAMATGHGTVNAVQNGNIYYQVVLGLAARPKRTSPGKAAGIATGAAVLSATGGLVAEHHLTAKAVTEAGTGAPPGAPLANPVQASTTTTQTTGSLPTGTAAPGAAKAGASGMAKVGAALTKAVSLGGAGAAGISAPVLATVVTVVAVVTTTVTVFVPRYLDHASCDTAAGGRPAAEVVTEAGRRVELTSFRYDVTRGKYHVSGAADPHTRTAWFRQGLTGGPVTTGTIDRGKVVLPTGATTPSGADLRWVRTDGAFKDAVDPAAPARELGSVTQARRKGCTFTGTLAPPAETGGTDGTGEPTGTAGVAGPAVARARTGPAEPVAATSASEADGSPVGFTARIDDRGRLVRLSVEASADRLPTTARYEDFGLTVAPSVPPSGGDAPTASEAAGLAGAWTGDWSTGFGTGGFTATLAQDGSRLTGELKVDGVPCDLNGSLNGTVDGNHITFGSVNSAKKITFTGSRDGDTMHGNFETDCYDAAGPWTARRSGS
ncbi:hypothetical protein [Streptomyces sp. NPDC048282]|uniref:hypothetical protein n=1 Tax=Streptomyces sp. NPDC048282 TaxID=3365528 RepID=UPI003713D7EA